MIPLDIFRFTIHLILRDTCCLQKKHHQVSWFTLPPIIMVPWKITHFETSSTSSVGPHFPRNHEDMGGRRKSNHLPTGRYQQKPRQNCICLGGLSSLMRSIQRSIKLGGRGKLPMEDTVMYIVLDIHQQHQIIKVHKYIHRLACQCLQGIIISIEYKRFDNMVVPILKNSPAFSIDQYTVDVTAPMLQPDPLVNHLFRSFCSLFLSILIDSKIYRTSRSQTST